jgi:hypothetical protein
MIGFVEEIEKIDNIAIGDPVVDITHSACKDESESKLFREWKCIDENNISEDAGDENRKEGKNRLSILMAMEKPEDPSEVSRMDNGKE